MKKIISLCLLSILMTAGAVHAGKLNTINVNPGPLPSYSVWIKLILTFHRPKMDCKSGFGICFDIQFGSDKAIGGGQNYCQAQARINAAGQLELMVTEEELLRYENGFALSYFKKGSLTFEDPYTFSDAVTKLLGSMRPVTINPGTFHVSYDASAQTYTVAFPL